MAAGRPRHAALLCESPPRIPCPIRAPRPLPATRSWKNSSFFKHQEVHVQGNALFTALFHLKDGNFIVSKSSDGQCHKCVTHSASSFEKRCSETVGRFCCVPLFLLFVQIISYTGELVDATNHTSTEMMFS